MVAAESAVVLAVLFFVFIFATGIWLSRSQRPFGGFRLNIHKLIALAAAVFVVITVRRASQVVALSVTETAVVVVTGLLFLATGVTGGLASIDKPVPRAITTLHHVLPHLTLLSSAATLYLLLRRG